MATSYRGHTAADTLRHGDGAGPAPPDGRTASQGFDTSGSWRDSDEEPSIGELVSEISKDISRLVRDEIELAKAEIKEDSAKAGKAAGMLGGAGYAGHLVMLLGSLTIVFALANVMDLAWAALIVTAVWAIAAAILFVTGRKRLRTVNLKPERTVDTLKEDARWVRNPTN